MLIEKIKNLLFQGHNNLRIEAEDFNYCKFNQDIFYVHILADTEDEDGELIDTIVYFDEAERDEAMEEAEDFFSIG
jgi:hypothetical protein